MRALRAVGALVAIAALVFVLLPFRARAYRIGAVQAQSDGSGLFGLEKTTASCGPAIIDAWHAKSPGRDVLTSFASSSPPPTVFNHCRSTAQHRAEVSLIALAATAALLAVTRRARASLNMK